MNTPKSSDRYWSASHRAWRVHHNALQARLSPDISWKSGLRRCEAIENNYKLAMPGIADELPPRSRPKEIGVVSYSRLGAGLLTANCTPGGTNFPAGSRFDVVPGHAGVYFGEHNFRVVAKLHEFAGRCVPGHRLALAFAFHYPNVTNVLAGKKKNSTTP